MVHRRAFSMGNESCIYFFDPIHIGGQVPINSYDHAA